MERRATIRYKVTDVLPEGRFGFLIDSNIDVCIRSAREPYEEYLRGLQINHPNYLSLIFYDSYDGFMVYKNYDNTLEAYLQQRRHVKVLNPYPIMDTNNILVKNVDYVDPFYRKIVKSIVRFVADIHMKGLALTEFNRNSLVFVGPCLKFVDVGFREGSPERRRADFFHLYQIVTELIFRNLTLPRELQHWAGLIGSLDYNREDCGLLLFHHLAIMSPKEALAFFVSCHERVPRLSPADRHIFRFALAKMHDCTGWFTKFAQPRGTKKVLPSRKCFLYKKNYCDSGDDIHVKLSLLRCCRNLVVHLKDNAPRTHKKPPLDLEELDIERMVIDVLADDLLSLQEALFLDQCLELVV